MFLRFSHSAILLFATHQNYTYNIHHVIINTLQNVRLLSYNQQNVGDLSHSFKFFPRFYPPKYPSKLFDTLQNCLACFWNFRTPWYKSHFSHIPKPFSHVSDVFSPISTNSLHIPGYSLPRLYTFRTIFYIFKSFQNRGNMEGNVENTQKYLLIGGNM